MQQLITESQTRKITGGRKPLVSIHQLPEEIKRNISSAPMPINYEAAKQALVECERIDECKGWVDRAVAIASYARQIKDRGMMETAERIQLRAQIRIGELLLEIPTATTGRPPKIRDKSGKIVDGCGPNTGTRRRVAMALGLRRGDAGRYVRAARVASGRREELIEASPPIKMTNLAVLAPPALPYKPRFNPGEGYRIAMTRYGVSTFATWAVKHSARDIAKDISDDEARKLRIHIRVAVEWLDEFEQHLPKEKPSAV